MIPRRMLISPSPINERFFRGHSFFSRRPASAGAPSNCLRSAAENVTDITFPLGFLSPKWAGICSAGFSSSETESGGTDEVHETGSDEGELGPGAGRGERRPGVARGSVEYAHERQVLDRIEAAGDELSPGQPGSGRRQTRTHGIGAVGGRRAEQREPGRVGREEDEVEAQAASGGARPWLPQASRMRPARSPSPASSKLTIPAGEAGVRSSASSDASTNIIATASGASTSRAPRRARGESRTKGCGGGARIAITAEKT